MPVTVDELARRLRAMRWAMIPHGAGHETHVARYHSALGTDDDNWAPESVDPTVVGSWHWWAAELLSHSGDERQRLANAGRLP